MTVERLSISIGILIVLLVNSSTAGLIGYHGIGEQHHYPYKHHQSVASSYMHFHGPVEGPEYEVKVPHIELHDEHNYLHGQQNGYTVDYVAHPKYSFSYGIEDHHTGDFHSQKETRDGSSVSGEYSVKEPNGNIRIVSYRADKDGFHAVVHNSGKNDHSDGTYDIAAAQGRELQVEDHSLGDQEQYLHDYPISFQGPQ